jgi:hypothetical protein
MRRWNTRLGTALVTVVGTLVTLLVAVSPARAAVCTVRNADNENARAYVAVQYEDCDNGTYRITRIRASVIETRYSVSLIVRRYVPGGGSTVISWQRGIGTLPADTVYEVYPSLTFNKNLNPYVYLRYRNSPSEPYQDSLVTRLPWVN